MVSKLSKATKIFLKRVFPHYCIFEEHYIKYKGTRLFFDFYVKEINVAIEVQGIQHDKFVKHFHDSRDGYIESKKRDNFKKEYCQDKGIVLVEIRSEKELNRDKFIKRIWEAMGN